MALSWGRWIVVPTVVLAVCVAHRGAAAAPAAQGIAFDEIARVVRDGGAMPPIDGFAADAAAIAALPQPSAPPMPTTNTVATMIVKSAVSTIPIVGGFLAAAATNARNRAVKEERARATAAAMDAVDARRRAGVLSHLAFLGDMSRIEPWPGRAIVTKPAERVVLTIDEAAKTYRSQTLLPEVETYTVYGLLDRVPLVVSGPVSAAMPDASIGSYAAHGVRISAVVSASDAAGFCSAGQHAVEETEYVAEIADPQPYPAGVPTGAAALPGVCTPTSPAARWSPGKLVLYRATTFDAGTPQAVTVVLERGNLRTLSESDSALFAVPAGFTPASGRS